MTNTSKKLFPYNDKGMNAPRGGNTGENMPSPLYYWPRTRQRCFTSIPQAGSCS